MTKFTREVRIHAPKEKVWAALADFGNIAVFNPTVPISYSTNNLHSGKGATRHCDIGTGGSSIEERVVAWQEGESMTIDIYAGKKAPPFRQAQATIAVREAGADVTIVRGTLEYSMKFGPLGALMDALMVKPQFGKAWTALFAGLKHHIETGEKVDGPQRLDFSVVQAVTA
jgi:uncharacterized protein YndB with AHSA1/START domain